MNFRLYRKTLPKRFGERLGLNHLISQHQLSKFKRGYRRLPIFFKLPIASKFALAILVALYFTGYQPVLAIPPIQKSVVLADFSQEQKIEPGTLSEAFSLPHPGYITTQYSLWHPGVDIAIGLGFPVHPISHGTVTDIKYGFFGYGNQVTVAHEQGYVSTYSHMGKIYAKTGDAVTKNSILGQVGLTGRTTGPHTHLEITKDGKYINPANILPTIPDFATYAKSVNQLTLNSGN